MGTPTVSNRLGGMNIEALHKFGTKPTKKDSSEIGLIMQGLREWERMKYPKQFKELGIQRYWKKDENILEEFV